MSKTLVKILINDPAGRFRQGEMGKLMENDYPSKYAYKVELQGLQEVPSFLNKGTKILKAPRVYYFHKHEVKVIS